MYIMLYKHLPSTEHYGFLKDILFCWIVHHVPAAEASSISISSLCHIIPGLTSLREVPRDKYQTVTLVEFTCVYLFCVCLLK